MEKGMLVVEEVKVDVGEVGTEAERMRQPEKSPRWQLGFFVNCGLRMR